MVTLDETINFYLDQNDLPQSKFDRISRIAIRGYRLFHRDSTGYTQTETLTVLSNGTAVLPVNALNKISVGLLNNRGEIASLTYDPLLSMFDATSTEREEQKVDDTLITNEEALISFQQLQGGLVPLLGYGQYGIGGSGTLGFYNIDWEQRVMIFNFGFKWPTVQFVYLGLPCEDGCYLLHPFFQEALISYIKWQDLVGQSRSNLGQIGMAKRDFDIQYQNARKAMSPLDLSDIYNQYRQSQRLAVKT